MHLRVDERSACRWSLWNNRIRKEQNIDSSSRYHCNCLWWRTSCLEQNRNCLGKPWLWPAQREHLQSSWIDRLVNVTNLWITVCGFDTSVYQNRTELVSQKIDFDRVCSQVPKSRQLIISNCSKFSRPILRFDLTHEPKCRDVKWLRGRSSHVQPCKSYAFV